MGRTRWSKLLKFPMNMNCLLLRSLFRNLILAEKHNSKSQDTDWRKVRRWRQWTVPSASDLIAIGKLIPLWSVVTVAISDWGDSTASSSLMRQIFNDVWTEFFLRRLPMVFAFRDEADIDGKMKLTKVSVENFNSGNRAMIASSRPFILKLKRQLNAQSVRLEAHRSTQMHRDPCAYMTVGTCSFHVPRGKKRDAERKKKSPPQMTIREPGIMSDKCVRRERKFERLAKTFKPSK